MDLRLLLAAAPLLGAVPLLAQDDKEKPVRVEKVEVTGSNISRVQHEGALPVTTLNRAEIGRSGATTAAELLEKITAIGAGGYNLSSGVGDSLNPGQSAVSLRGLGGSNTLVLLNGRRIAPYAFNSVLLSGSVNLNQVPLAAIERVEVLKDGASAIYGTDAIGGVINFILRKDYQGGEATAYGAWPEAGGAISRKFTASLGYGDPALQGFNVMAVVDYQQDSPLKASQREFASTAIRPDLGFAATSGNVYPANFRFRGQLTNVTAAQGCIPAAGSFQVNASTGQPAPQQAFCRYDFTSVLDIYPPAERVGLFVRGLKRLGEHHQAFAEYHVGRNEITYASSETPVNDFVGLGPYLYPAGGPYYPTTVTLPGGGVVRPTGDLPIAWRSKDAGLRTNRVDTDESRLLLGLQGEVLGWDYNTAIASSRSNVSETYVDGYVRDSQLRAAIATGLVDVFSGRPQDAQALALIDAAKIREKVRESDAKVSFVDARASREILQGRHGPLALAIGFERRKEELEERPEQVLFSGDILGGGGALLPTTRAERFVNSFFAELNVPMAQGLEAQLAIRHDQYSDFGGSTNPKIALRWTPAKGFLARASAGTGFRAPTLSDLFFPLSPGFIFGGQGFDIADPARCPQGEPVGAFVRPEECGVEVRAQFGGNPGLQPEESRQWSFGVLFEPIPGASLGIDYWTIRREDTILFTPEYLIFDTYGAADPVGAGGRFVRFARSGNGACVGDGAIPTPADVPCAIDYVIDRLENAGKYNVSGFDLSATFRHSMPDGGVLAARGEGTYFRQYRYQIQKDGAYNDNAGLATLDNGAVSRWRHYISLNWRRGPWTATVAHNFINGYLDVPVADLAPRRVGSYEAWDLQGTWEGWRALVITLGVRNLLDRDPPATRQQAAFQVGYDPRYYDPRGRTWYASLKYAFR